MVILEGLQAHRASNLGQSGDAEVLSILVLYLHLS
jgi:hypothetical protein